MTNTPIKNAGYKDLDGMRLFWIDNRTLNITSGIARSSDNTNDIVFLEDMPFSVDVEGVGGIDTGVVQVDKFYYLFAIGDSTKNLPESVIASLNQEPVMNGYDIFRTIGGLRTRFGSPDVSAFAQTGRGRDRWITYESPIQVVTAGAATSWTQINMTNIAPSTENMCSIMSALTPSVAGNKVMMRKNASAGSGSSVLSGDVAAVQTWSETILPYGGGGIFEYQVDAAGDSVDLYLKAYLHSL